MRRKVEALDDDEKEMSFDLFGHASTPSTELVSRTKIMCLLTDKWEFKHSSVTIYMRLVNYEKN